FGFASLYDRLRMQCNPSGLFVVAFSNGKPVSTFPENAPRISFAAAFAFPGHQTMGAKHFGARVARLEDPALLTGRARFVDDMHLPGALHACFVRSPPPHARVRSIDTTAARAMPGVHAVLTADDLPAHMAGSQIPMLVPNPLIKTPRTQLALARHEVCYVGQTIAVVVADTRYLAEDAAAAVAVDFDVLPAVSDCRDAARPDAP